MTTPDPHNPARTVRDEDAFDVEAVAAWIGRGPIAEVRQFAGGASNLTYRLQYADQPALVLRLPPAGTKARGAHDMGREHDVQAALAPVFPHVPAMVGHCTDESVIGSEFYVMEEVEGLVPRQDFPVPVSPEQASALCDTAVDTLVALHAVDVQAVPALAALDRGDGYVARQVAGWTRRFADARTDDTGDWSDVLGWLAEHQPGDVRRGMVHNDFRLDNLVLDPGTLAVRAVLDWEMATVGDPLMDLGGALAYWVQADDDEVFQLFRRQPTTTPGTWTRDEVVAAYLERSGLALPAPGWLFYEVFGLFRLAVIAQQIWYRYVHGQTTNEAFAVLGPAVGYLETRCRRLLAGRGSA
ncbi:phosphotransferase family protein [Nocardioides litoris]|uniref:phosphotransferase family protein n=1 Tax=Nocardioides litoris TaxID=1926648 RepID=UPI00111F38CD|nr:phosphotransferase family protein [Nocardioides litoris]